MLRKPSVIFCFGRAVQEVVTPYVEGADYKVDGDVVATSNYAVEYYPGYYYDPAGFSYYNQLNPRTYEPGFFSFSSTGAGPFSQWASLGLGMVFSYLQSGGVSASGPPHHLKVTNDVLIALDCGRIERRITYRIVDSPGAPAGGVPLMEKFTPAVIQDTCSGTTLNPEACTQDYPGQNLSKFTDVARVGCPATLANCGYVVEPNDFIWCRPQNPQGNVILARVYKDVKKDLVLINGRIGSWVGFEFYP